MQHRLEVAFDQGFHQRLLGLTDRQAKDVLDAVDKLRRGYSSVHLHALQGSDFKSFSVNRDALRIICHQEGEMLLLVHVDAHDKAYEWANRNRVRQIGNIIRVVETERVTKKAADAQHDGIVTPEGPLAAIPDKWFRRVDVEARVAEMMRAIPDEDALLELANCLKPALGEAILRFALEPDGWADAVRDFEAAKHAVARPTLAEAVQNPVNAQAIWVPPPGEEALAAALSNDLDSWRIFLHPSQKRLVRRRGTGAFKVTGGPGTGKTIVALHRARFLVEERFADDPRPVLLTTFSRALTNQLREQVELLCADAPHLLERIEVQTLVGVAQDLLERGGEPNRTIYASDQKVCWDVAMEHDTLGYDQSFYKAEREHVVEKNGAWTGTQYVRASRTGRGVRLDRAKKREVWKVLEVFEQTLRARGGGDNAALCREATHLVASGKVDSPWVAVVCDEIQDVGPSELRMLAALARDDADDGGGLRDDALFLCGDGYQRIYKYPVPLSHCGIPIVGRSSILRLNYRTTEGIRRYAVDWMKGVDPDEIDLDDPTELTTFDGYRSLRPGPVPQHRSFGSRDDELDWIAQEIERADDLTLILCRKIRHAEALRDDLRGRGHDLRILQSDDRLPQDARAVICSLHRSKGLEAPRVIIADAQHIPLRWHGNGGVQDERVWARKERCLMYVGITRARDWCAVARVEG